MFDLLMSSLFLLTETTKTLVNYLSSVKLSSVKLTTKQII